MTSRDPDTIVHVGSALAYAADHRHARQPVGTCRRPLGHDFGARGVFDHEAANPRRPIVGLAAARVPPPSKQSRLRLQHLSFGSAGEITQGTGCRRAACVPHWAP